jgi:hypothetical protein
MDVKLVVLHNLPLPLNLSSIIILWKEFGRERVRVRERVIKIGIERERVREREIFYYAWPGGLG